MTLTVEQLAALVRDQVAVALAEHAPTTEPDPLLLTCSKLCKRLGVSRASVFRWRGQGMPSIRTGDDHRYELTEVLAWLKKRSGVEGSVDATSSRGSR